MSNVVVFGLQWGDEGKGKIVDFLSDNVDCVVRFQGGHNAGHTIVVDGATYKLNLLPSGILRGNKQCVIGSGVVIDPHELRNEILRLKELDIMISPDNLMIAENAHLILSIHKTKDILLEEMRGDQKIGTTGRGIGPCYEDKVGRRGIRACDLRNIEKLEGKVDSLLSYHNALMIGQGKEPVKKTTIMTELETIADNILPYIKQVWKELNYLNMEGKKILFEGAQGAMLDIDYGTYPFVTSSNTLPSNAYIGSGLQTGAIDKILGIAKAYTTRVGSGPFPTELDDLNGQLLSSIGKESGTVTNRKRRCGWFDAVVVKQAADISGVTSIALTKLDVLDDFEKIMVCTGYSYNGKNYDYLPYSDIREEMTPVYVELDGWKTSTSQINSFENLPENARKYIEFIERSIGVPVDIISTGAERNDTIVRKRIFN